MNQSTDPSARRTWCAIKKILGNRCFFNGHCAHFVIILTFYGQITRNEHDRNIMNHIQDTINEALDSQGTEEKANTMPAPGSDDNDQTMPPENNYESQCDTDNSARVAVQHIYLGTPCHGWQPITAIESRFPNDDAFKDFAPRFKKFLTETFSKPIPTHAETVQFLHSQSTQSELMRNSKYPDYGTSNTQCFI